MLRIIEIETRLCFPQIPKCARGTTNLEIDNEIRSAALSELNPLRAVDLSNRARDAREKMGGPGAGVALRELSDGGSRRRGEPGG